MTTNAQLYFLYFFKGSIENKPLLLFFLFCLFCLSFYIVHLKYIYGVLTSFFCRALFVNLLNRKEMCLW